jgi:very-short-patch-repair endonuclease
MEGRPMNSCLECGGPISPTVNDYSMEHFGVPLCFDHQNWIREYIHETTEEVISLYFALKKRGVPVELEQFDDYKAIDITVIDAQLKIEVDSLQHNLDPQQALIDLKRTYLSFLKGFLTLRVPNSLIRWNLEETADFITEFLNERKNKQS